MVVESNGFSIYSLRAQILGFIGVFMGLAY
jgi:hypothetical protein